MAARPRDGPDAGVAAVYGEERPYSLPQGLSISPNLVKKISCLGVVFVCVFSSMLIMLPRLSVNRSVWVWN